MRVSLIGATGFVGSHLVPALQAAGHQPRLLVRDRPDRDLSGFAGCERVSGSIDDPEAVAKCLAGAEAVIYLIGILRAFPERGLTFEALQQTGVEHSIAAARAAGVERFLLMSANGVKADGTPYQRTKQAAEEALRASGLRWTIFRPSVIFGDPRGHQEFCTQLRRDLIDPPWPAPLFYPGLLPFKAGAFQLAPVAVEDVAEAFVRALDHPETLGQIFPLCGPHPLSWRQILETIAAATGRRKWMLPAPALGVRAVAAVLDRQPWFPVTGDQITMLMEGNLCDNDEAFRRLGITPKPFEAAALAYLRESPDSTRAPSQENRIS